MKDSQTREVRERPEDRIHPFAGRGLFERLLHRWLGPASVFIFNHFTDRPAGGAADDDNTARPRGRTKCNGPVRTPVLGGGSRRALRYQNGGRPVIGGETRKSKSTPILRAAHARSQRFALYG